MQVAGQQRTYLLRRPAVTGPLPTVIFLHGLGGNAERVQWTGLGGIGDREGFVTVFPNAIGGMWSVFPAGSNYSVPGFGTEQGADTSFIKELIGDLVQRGISDPNRIYLGGVSFGGFMTLRMACVAPELFAAIGVVSASMLDADGQVCQSSKPLPLVIIDGTADPVVPYAGGRTERAGFKVWGADRTAAYFRKLNGCSETSQRSELPRADWGNTPPIVVNSWTSCSGGPVVLYSVIGGGHRALGAGINSGFSTGQTLWDFFRDKTAQIH